MIINEYDGLIKRSKTTKLYIRGIGRKSTDPLYVRFGKNNSTGIYNYLSKDLQFT